MTALMLATRNSHSECVKILIESYSSSININAKDDVSVYGVCIEYVYCVCVYIVQCIYGVSYCDIYIV